VATVGAAAALAAAPVLSCATISQRITVSPGNLHPGSSGVYGPLATDSFVMVPGLIDGIYDT
jgi:hypothetical protein